MALLQQFSVQSQSGLVAQKVIFIFKKLQQKFGTMPCIWTWKTYLWSFMSIEDALSEYWQFSVCLLEWKQKYVCTLHKENRRNTNSEYSHHFLYSICTVLIVLFHELVIFQVLAKLIGGVHISTQRSWHKKFTGNFKWFWYVDLGLIYAQID